VSPPSSSRSAQPFPINIPIAAAIVAISAGAVGLAGWIFSVESLKSIVGTITMKANTAIALVSCGVSLFLTARGDARVKAVAQMLASFGVLIGALTLTEHLFGGNLGIDQVLFKEVPGAAATTGTVCAG
jgi:hypothetical protein